ncbi:hypothetical protein JHK87_052158 [Glycine soja]|nr:hypothetical protein JHK87_052158 [Glycine soja]
MIVSSSHPPSLNIPFNSSQPQSHVSPSCVVESHSSGSAVPQSTAQYSVSYPSLAQSPINATTVATAIVRRLVLILMNQSTVLRMTTPPPSPIQAEIPFDGTSRKTRQATRLRRLTARTLDQPRATVSVNPAPGKGSGPPKISFTIILELWHKTRFQLFTLPGMMYQKH